MRELPDLRLAGVAAGVWLAALAGLHLRAWPGLTVAGIAAVVATVLTATRRKHRWVAVGVLVGVAAGAGATAARVAVRDAGPIRELADQRVSVQANLVVTDDAHPTRAPAGRPAQYAVAADLTGLRATGHPAVSLSVRVLVLGADPAWQRILPGQRAVVDGRLGLPRGGDLRSAVLSVPGTPRLVGHASWAQRAAGRLRSGLRAACAPLPAEPGGLLPGLVVGDTTRLEPAVSDDFRSTGMTHLLAVSGLNDG